MRFINAFGVTCALQVMILLTKIFNFSQNFIHFTISLNLLLKLLLVFLRKFSNVMASKMVKEHFIMWVCLSIPCMRMIYYFMQLFPQMTHFLMVYTNTYHNLHFNRIFSVKNVHFINFQCKMKYNSCPYLCH